MLVPIKRIGDGRQTNIWSDSIPDVPSLKAIYRKQGAEAERVSDLISSRWEIFWDVQALRQNLISSDEKSVLKIPLGSLEENIWSWSAEKHGMYTVKSAYKLLASHHRSINLAKRKIINSSCSENNPL